MNGPRRHARALAAWAVLWGLGLQAGAVRAQALADPQAQRREALQSQLVEARQAEAQATTLWPVLLMGVGGSVGLGAGIAGIVLASTCTTDDCHASPAIGILVVAGVAVMTSGVIWWRRQLENLQRAQSTRVQLERDLEYLKLSEPTPPPPKDGLSLSVSLRF